VNIVNLEEPLQSSSIESFLKTQGKISPMLNNDKEIEKIAASKMDSQNFVKKDVTEFRKRIQNLQREFNRLCSLISDLLIFLHHKVSPKLLEPNANQEDIHLTPLQLIAVTNTLAERISWNPSVRRILMAKDLSQIRCYICNKIGDIANIVAIGKHLISRQISLDIIFTSIKNDPRVVLISNVIRDELIHSHSSRTYEVLSC